MWILATVLLGAVHSGYLQAANSLTKIVTRPISGNDRLQVQCDFETPLGGSFAVARVQVAPLTGVSPRDRNLQVAFFCKGYVDRRSYHFVVRKNVTLGEGQTMVTVDLPHAFYAGDFQWDLGVFENGRDIEDSEKSSSTGNLIRLSNATVQRPSGLGQIAAIIGPNENRNEVYSQAIACYDPPVEQANGNNNQGSSAPQQSPNYGIQGYGGPGYGGPGYGNMGYGMGATTNNFRQAASNAGVRAVAIRDCSTDWRYYLRNPTWVLSFNTLTQIAESHSDVQSALRTYVAGGGKLFVYGVKDVSAAERVAKLLGVPDNAFPAVKWYSIDDAQWHAQRVTRDVVPRGVPNQSASQSGGASPDDAVQNDVKQAELKVVEPKLSIDKYRSRLNQELSDGMILGMRRLCGQILIFARLPAGNLELKSGANATGGGAVESQDGAVNEPTDQRPKVPSSGEPTPNAKRTATAAIKPGVLSRARLAEFTPVLEGISAARDGNWSWKNLISAVGKPPVWAFCGIVTLFGALLGPGLLFITGRIGRRSLMIFLVPAFSLLATLLITLYGVLHEGLGTDLRVTSVAHVDTTRNEAFIWSRQNYFSGLPPRDGLKFPGNVYVREVVPFDDSRQYYLLRNPKSGVEYALELTEDQVLRGWLKARRQQQLLVGQMVEQYPLPIQLRRKAANRLLVRNISQQSIPLYVSRGAGNAYFVGEDIAAGEEIELLAVDSAAAAASVARLAVDLKPQVPQDLRGSGSLLSFGRGGYSASWRSQSEVVDVINFSFSKYLSDQLALPSFGFALAVEDCPEVTIPMNGRSEERLQIVTGVMPW